MKKAKTKKIGIICIIVILIVAIIYLWMDRNKLEKEVNASNNSSTTTISNVEVGTQTITKTLTSSGQIASAVTENLALSTTKYFKTMCVEENEYVAKGDNILEYTNGTYLTAPYNCVVVSYVVPTTGTIGSSNHYVQIQSLEKLAITISVEESQIDSVYVGQEVKIVLNADEEKSYTGTVSKVNQIGSYATSGTTYTAMISLENDGNIKLGMSTSCTITLEEANNVVAVPIAAVQTKDNKKYVVQVIGENETKELEVQTGISNDSYVEVKEGLAGGETIQTVTTTGNASSRKSSNKSTGGQMEMMPGGGEMPSGMTR